MNLNVLNKTLLACLQPEVITDQKKIFRGRGIWKTDDIALDSINFTKIALALPPKGLDI